MKQINIFKFIRYISYYFNEESFKCCICLKKPNIFYLICKPNCISNSYCKECIYRIERENGKCPFTNTKFTYEDISMDYRKNKSLEIYKEIFNDFNEKKIKINIDIS